MQHNLLQPGFTSVTPLTPVNVLKQTKDKPQAKAWNYANKWWCALSAVGGTKIFRLDGTSWTETLTLTTTNSKPDCWVAGDLVHVLLYKGSTSPLYSIKYDVASNAYKLWSTRPAPVNVTFPSGSETATLLVDSNGRMWAAAAGTTEVTVRWSDSPYSTWSAPITIATGVNDDDICALTVIPSQNKIGILWSNQNTKRFGFRTHTDNTSPGSWSADEVPASQSAIDNVGKGMADDHINIVAASDGTLYCAVKTGYDNLAYPESILLVRRTSGTWDNAYTVSNNGTQAVVVLNEVLGKVKVIYTTATGGGNIVCRESSTSNISFGSEIPLMSGVLNYASSTHQTHDPDVVILATDETSTPWRALSVLASDAST